MLISNVETKTRVRERNISVRSELKLVFEFIFLITGRFPKGSVMRNGKAFPGCILGHHIIISLILAVIIFIL